MRARKLYHGTVGTIAVMPDDSLRYRYKIDGGCQCEFATLAEVGEPWVPGFRKLISLHGLRVRPGVEIDDYPWVVDMLVRR
jgi:hypothetical protein